MNTVDLYQISRVILSYFLGIPSEFLGNRWQYYSRHLQKIYCIPALLLRKLLQNVHIDTGYYLLYINIGTYWWIRTYVYKYVLVNTYLKDWKSISDNNLLNNNVNTVVEYQMHRLILSCFRGIPSEFLGNRWQY